MTKQAGMVDVHISKGTQHVAPTYKVCKSEFVGKIYDESFDEMTPDKTTADSSRWKQELDTKLMQQLESMKRQMEREREEEREQMKLLTQRADAEWERKLRELQEQHAREKEAADRRNTKQLEHMKMLLDSKDKLKTERQTMGISTYKERVEENRTMFLKCVEQMDKVKTIPVSIGVVGRTSAGKSSLLNKLYGTSCAVAATKCTSGVQEVCRYLSNDQRTDISIWDVFGFNDEEAYESIETINEFVSLHAVLLLYRDSIESCKNTIELFRAADVKVVVVRSQIDTLKPDELQEIENVEAQKAHQYGADHWTKVTVKTGNSSDELKVFLDNLIRQLCVEGNSVSCLAPSVLTPRGILKSPREPASAGGKSQSAGTEARASTSATEVDIYVTAQDTPETVPKYSPESSLSPSPVPTYLPTKIENKRERHMDWLDVRDLHTTVVASTAAKPAAWTVDETVAFFQRLSFADAAIVVLQNGVDGKTMLDLTDDDLKKELGLQNLQVKRVRKEIEAMLEGGRG